MGNLSIKEVDDDLHRRARVAALEEGITLKAWIERAIANELDRIRSGDDRRPRR